MPGGKSTYNQIPTHEFESSRKQDPWILVSGTRKTGFPRLETNGVLARFKLSSRRTEQWWWMCSEPMCVPDFPTRLNVDLIVTLVCWWILWCSMENALHPVTFPPNGQKCDHGRNGSALRSDSAWTRCAVTEFASTLILPGHKCTEDLPFWSTFAQLQWCECES